MGERLSGSDISGRRAHPGVVPGPRRTDLAVLEPLIAAALRADVIDEEAEQRALAAYRAARDAGAHRMHTRRRDDWRRRGLRTRRSMRAALGVLAASLALGGVAYATIGPSGFPHTPAGDRPARHRPATDAPDRTGGTTGAASRTSAAGHSPTSGAGPSATPSAPAAASTDSARPVPAGAAEAHCRAWAKLHAKGRAPDTPAWRRLVAEAGGEDRVADFCARLADAPATSGPSTGTGRSGTTDSGRSRAGDADGDGKRDGDGGRAGGGTDGTGGTSGTGTGTGRTSTAVPDDVPSDDADIVRQP
ncbi:hypothetical protein MTQ10_29085 [Streptomyces sp. XM83C]|uniref:hypothetical protein n=1 Tax=Streptomyces sp. XM83C TaxID=2929781 RepID=UPI001FF6FDA6|nr:hypothetical protein [Streptomyces sp. XM83C]MCK1823532.1 hypothetical protein [Streptomyces sp. XM83C]